MVRHSAGSVLTPAKSVHAMWIEKIVSEHGGVLAGFGGALILLLFIATTTRLGNRERRRRFENRLALPEETLYQLFLPRTATEADQKVIRDVLDALARCIGVRWTQLRPTDTFSGDLSRAKLYRGWDDLEDFEDYIAVYLQRGGLSPGALGRAPDRLDLFLKRLLELTQTAPASELPPPSQGTPMEYK